MRCCVAACLTVGTFEAGECAVRVQSCWLKRHLTCCSLLCMPACFTKRDVCVCGERLWRVFGKEERQSLHEV